MVITFSLVSFCTNYVFLNFVDSEKLKICNLWTQKEKKRKEKKSNTLVKSFSSNDFKLSSYEFIILVSTFKLEREREWRSYN